MTHNNRQQPLHATTLGWEDYEILDSGNSRKLERFGSFTLARFEPQAVWKPALPASDWLNADATFQIEKGKQTGRWQTRQDLPQDWTIGLKGLTLELRVRNSRHVGVFPEQLPGWLWLEEQIRQAASPPKVLNLFGYTGVASLFAARAGAEVTHVDASRASVKWAQHNQALSGLDDLPIRWIVDDAFKFVQREARRGNRYDGILLDPPRFGRGPKGEVWKFEQTAQELLQACRGLLVPAPLFVYLTAYDVANPPAELHQWVQEALRGLGGQIDFGWMVQQEKSAGRKINQSMFVRWHTS
ncbi:MAG: rRNA (cytosine1962-C5)-methyltransferase [Chloroflexota bacterium]|nr:rRNA (cytosine1962-C5)-methyltransferase [Chloroflexota bacterium]